VTRDANDEYDNPVPIAARQRKEALPLIDDRAALRN
jgi:hypothetical protein